MWWGYYEINLFFQECHKNNHDGQVAKWEGANKFISAVGSNKLESKVEQYFVCQTLYITLFKFYVLRYFQGTIRVFIGPEALIFGLNGWKLPWNDLMCPPPSPTRFRKLLEGTWDGFTFITRPCDPKNIGHTVQTMTVFDNIDKNALQCIFCFHYETSY